MKREQALERFLTLTNVRFETSDEDPWLNAVLVDADGDGRATSIEQLLVPARPSAQRQDEHASSARSRSRDQRDRAGSRATRSK